MKRLGLALDVVEAAKRSAKVASVVNKWVGWGAIAGSLTYAGHRLITGKLLDEIRNITGVQARS